MTTPLRRKLAYRVRRVAQRPSEPYRPIAWTDGRRVFLPKEFAGAPRVIYVARVEVAR
ncbi:hypothetical protein IS481_12130 [Caldimonas thermodepolymerans]|uniref:hypothetical protein n=1 Tax=Caldimonas thermodepolymerans TaxID=215580 RepID=UPI000E2DAC56|nr:hypothetical protein [Caldimonas thermodepolymerans]QPC30518.1 hypothetical protein IS481_12130 [Caldimonas thermodepolymerans]RDI02895.1 hypothetical protein DES46_102323 [Caldimonas thermodepolymerans]